MASKFATILRRNQLLANSALCRSAIILAAGFAGTAHAQEALPTGGAVTQGNAAIDSSAQSLTVTQSSSRAVINWNSFSVSEGRSVTFNQPDAASATLNRVTGNATSAIAGTISSNGAVYLVNPNGIAITSTGVVETAGGFVASTLDIADGDFMAGTLAFVGKGASGHVSNAGRIAASQGAYVALLGGSVSNSGTVTVPLGRVGLGSGESIALDLNGDGFMQVAVPTSALTGTAALTDHSGTITAAGGRIEMRAAALRNAVRQIVNMSGTLNADSATSDGGTIYLIGGSDRSDMAGSVGVTGVLSARATGARGNGGFIETSGATIDFTGATVDTSAANGTTGNWLIDPFQLEIGAAAAATVQANLATTSVALSVNGSGCGGPGTCSFYDPFAGVAVPQITGNYIWLRAPISWSSANELALISSNDIVLDAAITGTNGRLTLQAGAGSSIGRIYPNAAINVNRFQLDNGNWVQNAATLPAFAARDFRMNNETSSFLRVVGGTGSVSSPYLLTDVYGLQGITGNGVAEPIAGPRPLLSQNFALANAIDASVTATWNGNIGFLPIGIIPRLPGGNLAFTGSLDGRNFQITNLRIGNMSATTTDVGVFNSIGTNGSVRDLALVNVAVSGTGGLFGGVTIGALAGSNSGAITNVSSSGSVSAIGDFGKTLGGLVGSNSGVINRSTSSVAVAGTSFANNQATVGGLVGFNALSILASSATGSATTSGGRQSIGGLVGQNLTLQSFPPTFAQITSSFASATVSASNGSADIGGLVGNNGGNIFSSFANSNVVAPRSATSVGGLVGFNVGQGSVSQSYALGRVSTTNATSLSGVVAIGGLVGANYSTVIESYAATALGNVSDNPFGGGLIGLSSGGRVTRSYFDTQISGTTASAGVGATGLTTAQMQNFATAATVFSGWDFTSVWAPPAQSGQAGQTANFYPQLYSTTPVVVATPANITRDYGVGNPLLGTLRGGPSVYVFGPANDTLANAFTTSATTTSGVGAYPISVAGNVATSSSGIAYRVVNIGAPDATLTVTPRALTVTYTANVLSAVYGTQVSNVGAGLTAFSGLVSATGFVNGDTLRGVTRGAEVFSSALNGTPNVGNYAIAGGGLVANSSNYAFTFAQAAGNATALTINPAPLTVTYTANTASRLYGSANPVFAGTQSATGLVTGDTLTSVTTGTASYSTSATAASDIGTYAVTGSGLTGASNNYTYSFVQAPTNAMALRIDPAPLTVTYTANALSRLYGAANPLLTGTQNAIGLVNGQTLASVTTGTATYSTAATTASNIGSYAVTGAGLTGNSANYSFTFAQASANATALTINPAPLTVTYTANALSRLYGATNPALSGSQSAAGLVNGQTLANVTTGTAAYATSATTTSGVGAYAITGSGLSGNSTNYSFAFVQAPSNAAALTINPAPLTVTYTANTASRLYGDSNPVFSGTQSATGLVNGDTLAGLTTGTASYASGAGLTSNIGSYAVTGSGLAVSSANYSVSFAQAASNATALAVTPRPLSVSANAVSRLYGAANPALSFGTTGLVNGDTLTGALATTATAASNVGTYGITQGSLVATPNYALTYTGANLTVTPAPLTITYAATATSRVYGATNPALTGSQAAAGLINGDTLGGVTSGAAVYSTSANGTSNAGTYAINGSGLASNSANYSFTFTQAAANASALSVTPRPLTVTADRLTREFGFPNPALTYVVGTATPTSGLVNGDTLSGALSTTAVQSSPSGDYPIVQGTLSASSNYRLSFTGNMLTVKLLPLQSLNSFLKPFDLNIGAEGQQGATGWTSQSSIEYCQASDLSAALRTNGNVPVAVSQGGTTCAQ